MSVVQRMHLSAYRVTCTRPHDPVESRSSQGDQRSSPRSRERCTPRPTTNPHVVFMDAADFCSTPWGEKISSCSYFEMELKIIESTIKKLTKPIAPQIMLHEQSLES